MGSLDQYFLTCLTAFLAKSREITFVYYHHQWPHPAPWILGHGPSSWVPFLRMLFVRATKPRTVSAILDNGSLFFIGIS